MQDPVLRAQLVSLLEGSEAHVSARDALDQVSPKSRNVRPAPDAHSVWEELEHLRIAQEDILRFALDASWQSPKWPEGYWPEENQNVTDEMWQSSVDGFFRDLGEVVKLAQNETLDLSTKFPHGNGQTYLRQILLVADHNAYHLGQIVQARKLLGDWKS